MPETTETAAQPKESFLKRNGHIIFWGTVIALPAMNMTAAVFNYKTIQARLELEKLKALTDQVQS